MHGRPNAIAQYDAVEVGNMCVLKATLNIFLFFATVAGVIFHQF